VGEKHYWSLADQPAEQDEEEKAKGFQHSSSPKSSIPQTLGPLALDWSEKVQDY